MFVHSSEKATIMAPITVRAYHWDLKDDREGDSSIFAWTLDQNSKVNLVRIEDYRPNCYLELPPFVKGSIKQHTWQDIELLHDYLVNAFPDLNIQPFRDGDYSRKHRLYMHDVYSDTKKRVNFPYLRLRFANENRLRAAEKVFSHAIPTSRWGNILLHIREGIYSGVSTIRKMLSSKEASFSGWLRCDGVETTNPISNAKEWIVPYESITPVPLTESKHWKLRVPVFALDIECYCHRERGFPDKLSSKDAMYMISGIYQVLGERNTRKRFGILYGDCDLFDIPAGTKLYKTKSEVEAVEKLGDLIRETNPIIITGYNIFTFDFPYIQHRVERMMEKLPVMGMVDDEVPYLHKSKWRSSAYGYQTNFILTCSGRISIDILTVVKRDYKLRTYGLGEVSSNFLGISKLEEDHKEMFKRFERNQAAIKSGDEELLRKSKAEMRQTMEYCLRDSELCIDLMEKLNIWVSLSEMSNIVGTSIMDIFTRGQQIRCVSQLYDRVSKQNIVINTRVTEKVHYVGGAVAKPRVGVFNHVICLDFSSLYPSLIRAFNICYTTLIPKEKWHLFDKNDCHIIKFVQNEPLAGVRTKIAFAEDGDEIQYDDDAEEYEEDDELDEEEIKKKGATKRVYYEFRFVKPHILKGVVPSIVENLVMERKKVNEEKREVTNEVLFDLEMRDLLQKILSEDKNGENEKFDTSKLQAKEKKWLEKNKLSLEELIASEAERKEKIKETLLYISVLDKRQLALKVSANSFYGFLGVQSGGKLPLIEGALSTTAQGRAHIRKARKYVEEKYGGVQIYGDTDSIMMQLPQVKSAADCAYWGKRLAEEISGLDPGATDCDGKVWPEGRESLCGFIKPLAMEFEKAMRLFCMKKKKYAYYIIQKNGQFLMEKGSTTRKDLQSKGIILARRDNHKFLQKVYDTVLRKILDGYEGPDKNQFRFEGEEVALRSCYEYVFEEIRKLLRGEVDVKDLSIVKGLGANYKSDSYFMAVFSKRLKQSGIDVKAGDRLDFLIKQSEPGAKFGEMLVLMSEYYDEKRLGNEIPIAYQEYLIRTMRNPIDQLFSSGYKMIFDRFRLGMKRTPRVKNITPLSNVVQCMSDLVTVGEGFEGLEEAVYSELDRLEREEENEEVIYC